MIWKTPITTADTRDEYATLAVDGQTDTLAACGPTFAGRVYRSIDQPRCYRLIPQADAPIQRRAAVEQWANMAAPGGFAAPTAHWVDAAMGVFVVQYDLPDLRCSLAEVLADADLDLTVRVSHVAQALDWLHYWVQSLDAPIFLTPGDIVFGLNGDIRLLAMPRWRLPDVAAVLEAPVLARYLAPEFVCSRLDMPWGPAAWQNLAQFAIGAMLVESFHRVPEPTNAAIALEYAAGGWREWGRGESLLTYWQGQLAASRDALACAERLMQADPVERCRCDPNASAALLRDCVGRINPVTAVAEVKSREGERSAFELVQNILLDDESYDLLMLAGGLASQINRPLEAIDFYERAIAAEPHRSDAYRAQFDLINTAQRYYGTLDTLFTTSIDAASLLCQKMVRNFERLPHDDQRERQISMARFLVWYGDQMNAAYPQAIAFIYPRLVDEDGAPKWWEFELNLAYAEALIGAGRLEDADQQVRHIANAIRRAQGRPDLFDRRKLNGHINGLEKLKGKLLDARARRTDPPERTSEAAVEAPEPE